MEVEKMKIYISPSVQDKNIGVGNYGTEEQRMNQIADVVMRELAKHKNIELKRNQPNFGANDIIRESNNFNTDYHIAIHSNAGGGQGCEVYGYLDGTNNNSVKMCNRIYSKVSALTPSKDRGIKDGRHLFEVGDQIIGASTLIEVAFHDNWADATFIIENIEKIGQAIVEGILEHLTLDRGKDVSLIQTVVNKPVTVVKPVEKIVYVDKPVEVIKYVDKVVEKVVEKEVKIKVKVPVEKIVYQDKFIEKEFTFKELILEILKYIKRLFKRA